MINDLKNSLYRLSFPLVVIALVSCQSIPRERGKIGNGAWIPEGAMYYVGIDALECKALVKAFLTSRNVDPGAMQELLARTRSVLMGVYETGEGKSVVATIAGDFPRGAIDWAFGNSSGFTKNGDYWVSEASGLSLRSASDTILVVETTGAPRSAAERPNGEITSFGGISGSALILLFDPATRVIPKDDDTDIPLERALIAFGTTNNGLSGDAAFFFKEGAKPKIYLPLVKLFTFSLYRDLGFTDYESLLITLGEATAVISGGKFSEATLAAYLVSLAP